MIIAPRDEALEWDLKHEIASTGRSWRAERQAWWISTSYLPTVRSILARFPDLDVHGAPPGAAPPPVERPAEPLPAPPLARLPLLARAVDLLRRSLSSSTGYAGRATPHR